MTRVLNAGRKGPASGETRSIVVFLHGYGGSASGTLRNRRMVEPLLARGYAVVRGGGEIVTTKAAAEQASGLEIEFADGRLKLGGGGTTRKAKTKPPEQGSLF